MYIYWDSRRVGCLGLRRVVIMKIMSMMGVHARFSVHACLKAPILPHILD